MTASTAGILPNPVETAPPLPTFPPLSFAEIVSGNQRSEVQTSPRALSKSFASVFTNVGPIQIKKPGMHKGEPAVFFSKEEISKLALPFRFTVIGKFPVRRPSMEIIRKFFSSLGLSSLKLVGLLQDNHVVIFINNEADYSRLTLRGTWYVSGMPMKIIKWSPHFVPSYESPIVPVWIAFPGLPIHYFEKTVLFSLASTFGLPLMVDEPTANLSRPTVARVCVDVDVSKEKFRLWIGTEKEGYWQDVEFENPPDYCDFCKMLGHRVDVCYAKNPELKTQKEQKKKEVGESGVSVTIPIKIPPILGSKSSNLHASSIPLDSEEKEWETQKSKKWRRKEKSGVCFEAKMLTTVEETPAVPLPLKNFEPLAKEVVGGQVEKFININKNSKEKDKELGAVCHCSHSLATSSEISRTKISLTPINPNFSPAAGKVTTKKRGNEVSAPASSTAKEITNLTSPQTLFLQSAAIEKKKTAPPDFPVLSSSIEIQPLICSGEINLPPQDHCGVQFQSSFSNPCGSHVLSCGKKIISQHAVVEGCQSQQAIPFPTIASETQGLFVKKEIQLKVDNFWNFLRKTVIILVTVGRIPLAQTLFLIQIP